MTLKFVETLCFDGYVIHQELMRGMASSTLFGFVWSCMSEVDAIDRLTLVVFRCSGGILDMIRQVQLYIRGASARGSLRNDETLQVEDNMISIFFRVLPAFLSVPHLDPSCLSFGLELDFFFLFHCPP